MPTATAPFHLLQLRDMPAAVLRELLHEARALAQQPDGNSAVLAGVTVVNLFLEDSTRTRISFSMAAASLGATVFDLTGTGSSASKGETITDTARVLESQGARILVVRAAQAGAPQLVADTVRCSVINAGDGCHEHPTQGLLDAYTIAEAFDLLDSFDFSGLRIAIVGDLLNSRVARSGIAAFTTLGATVVCIGPPDMVPGTFADLGCEISHDLNTILPTIHAVQMLRIQHERGSNTNDDYIDNFQLNQTRADTMQPNAIVLHPGPMNRGVEITSDVADGPRSRIFRQTANGVHVRKACLLRAAASLQ